MSVTNTRTYIYKYELYQQTHSAHSQSLKSSQVSSFLIGITRHEKGYISVTIVASGVLSVHLEICRYMLADKHYHLYRQNI